jgi:hypothetical protein
LLAVISTAKAQSFGSTLRRALKARPLNLTPEL